MVRIICLIFVFGIASLCVASFIHATTAYARMGHAICPCWPGGPTELAATLGNPTTTNITFAPCDTNHRSEDFTAPAQLRELGAEVKNLDETGADALIIWNIFATPHGIEVTACDLFSATVDQPMDDITVSEAQECMQDILAYCRAYCKHNPNAQCQ